MLTAAAGISAPGADNGAEPLFATPRSADGSVALWPEASGALLLAAFHGDADGSAADVLLPRAEARRLAEALLRYCDSPVAGGADAASAPAAAATAAIVSADRRIPLDVALALVTGRRVDRPEHGAEFTQLLDALVQLAAGGEPSPEQLKSEAFFTEVQRLAGRYFPAIAHETGAELDLFGPGYARAWLAEREARYGDSITPASAPGEADAC